MKHKPAPRFRDGFLVSGRRQNASLLTGRLLPQPLVGSSSGQEVLLDDCLGARFTLLAYGRGAIPLLSGLRQPIWNRIGVDRLAILPSVHLSGPNCSVSSVVDPDGSMASLFGGEVSRILLVRPDRYVVAAIEGAKADEGARAFEKLVDGTWNSRR